MFRALRNRIHVSPATAIATLALVFAMTGGAYAAGKYLITSTKQISPKVLKSLTGKAGKAGANGANGATGPAGATGPSGPAGPGGPQGPAGTAGTNGTNGTNGKDGKAGKEGSPWTAGGTLPSGSTETGTWDTVIGKQNGLGIGIGPVPISFTIPFAAALPEANIKIKPEGYDGTDNTGTEHEECPGKAAEPKAKAGFLCVYKSSDGTGAIAELISSTTVAGVTLNLVSANEGKTAEGTWAVTAP
jgi:hypothetical protein